MHPTTLRAAFTGVALLVLLSGCAAPVSDDDRAALDRLAEVAGPTSGVEPALIDRTECWLPSDNLIDDPSVNDTTWRVLCRVFWQEPGGQKRYQDTTCIGDFSANPMLDACYRWTYYDLMPVYEDEPGVLAG